MEKSELERHTNFDVQTPPHMYTFVSDNVLGLIHKSGI